MVVSRLTWFYLFQLGFILSAKGTAALSNMVEPPPKRIKLATASDETVVPLLLQKQQQQRQQQSPVATRVSNNHAPKANHAVVIRRLKKCQDMDQVVSCLDQEFQDRPLDPDHDEPILAQAISMCGKFKNATQALQFLQQIPTSELCRSRVISICGSQGRGSDCLALLKGSNEPLTTSGPYNAAIASCGRQKDWSGAWSVLHDIMPVHLVTSITLNAVLTALQKSRCGTQALQLLNEMERKWSILPDRISYHCTLSALLGQGKLEEGCDLIQAMAQSSRPEVSPNQETFSRLAAAVSGKPTARALVAKRLGNTMTQLPEFASFQSWNLTKVGQGKSCFWEIGQVTICNKNDNSNNNLNETLVVGLSPNRNPAANGVRLNFYRRTSSVASKNATDFFRVGYLLMINTSSENNKKNANKKQKKTDAMLPCSQFLGQFVDHSERGRGWAKVWLAIWMQLCLDAGIQPCTGKIQKPLLSLVLEHSFGMHPTEGGLSAELSPGDDAGSVVLYSSNGALEGVFSPLDLRNQNISIARLPTEPRGRPIVVGSSYEWPGEQTLRDRVSAVLSQHQWKLVENVEPGAIKNILLGT